MLTIEGPRFSSRAESLMFRQWGADVINMTTVPEVVLAKEAGLCYASIAMATDYDCWKEHEEAVSAILERVFLYLQGEAGEGWRPDPA
uniref:Nucleoside phosphorylase domain-containing protein n=1 Tax=Oryzias sinensis TaxID=183150 RepID=A0A8C7YCJ9_9TELE